MIDKKEIVVTGIHGFVGGHLARELKNSGYLVHGIGREQSPRNGITEFISEYSQCNMLDFESISKISLKNSSAIIHLAGLASVAESFTKPELYETANATMTENLFKSAMNQGFSGRILAISTGALYSPDQAMPLNELSKTTDASPYSKGKLRAEDVVKKYEELGIDGIIVRPFNHIGPGQSPGFLVSDLYDQLLTVSDSSQSEILVGNLTTKRDYTDVRDIVKAYTLLAGAINLQHRIYNVSSGKSYSGLQIIDYLKNEMKLNNIKTRLDPSRVRPGDAKNIVGDASRLKDEIGWTTESSVEVAIRDFVAYRES